MKGDLDGALQLFEAMVAKGVKADTVMYNTILDGAVRASRFTLCDQLIQKNNQIWHHGLKLHPFDHCEDVGQAEAA
eukprot:symbB.v1.2.022293.t1/scaffold1969.1/size94314/7